AVAQGQTQPEVVVLICGQGGIEAADVEDGLSPDEHAGGSDERAGEEAGGDVAAKPPLALAKDPAVVVDGEEPAEGQSDRRVGRDPLGEHFEKARPPEVV